MYIEYKIWAKNWIMSSLRLETQWSKNIMKSCCKTDMTRHLATLFLFSFILHSNIIYIYHFLVQLSFIIKHSFIFHFYWLVCVAVCDVWLCLCSYAGSVATTIAGAGQGMECFDQLDDYNIDLVNLNELMQGYRQ